MKTKNKRILVILFFTLVFCVTAGVLLYRYLTPMQTTIYVFRDNYKAGTIVSNDILVPTQVDSKIAVAGAETDVSTWFVTGNNKHELIEIKENALRMDVAKGMPLTQSMLSIDGGSYIEMTMDDKKVAVTVPVTSISGVTKDLKEGSRVNIYSTGYTNSGTTGTTLIFSNMRILTVDRDSDGDLISATIEVSTEESLKLVEAATYSELYFGLVNGSSYQAPEQDMTYAEPPVETTQEQTEPENTDSTDTNTEGQSQMPAGGGGD